MICPDIVQKKLLNILKSTPATTATTTFRPCRLLVVVKLSSQRAMSCSLQVLHHEHSTSFWQRGHGLNPRKIIFVGRLLMNARLKILVFARSIGLWGMHRVPSQSIFAKKKDKKNVFFSSSAFLSNTAQHACLQPVGADFWLHTGSGMPSWSFGPFCPPPWRRHSPVVLPL